MPKPNPVRLFHITAIPNLQEIFVATMLLAKNVVDSNNVKYQNIAHQGAQEARSRRTLPTPPGGNIHDYVPFYFAPRSPMLSAIHNKRVANCDFTQSDIVHIETTVNAVTGLGQPFVFFDRNATFDYSNAYTNLAQLDQVAWDLITETPQLDGYCKFFQDDQTKPRYVDRKAKRMAEFLVKTRVPIGAITRIGVHTQAKRLEVQQIATTYNITTPIIVMPDWYF